MSGFPLKILANRRWTVLMASSHRPLGRYLEVNKLGSLLTVPLGTSESEKRLVQKTGSEARMRLLFFQRPVCKPGPWPSSGNLDFGNVPAISKLTRVAHCVSAVCASTEVVLSIWFFLGV